MGIFDVAFTGTSLTTGIVAHDWKLEAQGRLQAGASREVRVYDLGKPAMASDWGLENIQHVANAKPKIACFEFAINDAYTSYNISLAQSRANAEAIIDAIRAGSPGTRIYMMTMNPVSSASFRPRLVDYYAQYRRIALEKGVGLIDNYPVWGAFNASEIPDGVHPAINGLRRVLIPNVVATLKPLIA